MCIIMSKDAKTFTILENLSKDISQQPISSTKVMRKAIK